MKKPYPCLWFSGEALEAAKYYVSVFKGSKLGQVTRFDDPSTGKKKQVLTVRFTLNGQPFLALNGNPRFAPTEAFSFVVTCKDQREIDTLWKKLTANGGQELQCGWLKDKYGVAWQIVPENIDKLIAPPAAMQAMFGMRKLDIAALKKAGAGSAKKVTKKR